MAQDVSQDLALHGLLGGPGPGPGPTPDWQRPSEWPETDSLVDGSTDLMVGLYAIPDNVDPSDGEVVAFTLRIAGSGTYDVDWGDGTSDTGIASNTAAQHIYDPTNVNLTATSYGYKVAKIVVTPSANVTGLNLRTHPTIGGDYSTNYHHRYNWLEFNFSLKNLVFDSDNWWGWQGQLQTGYFSLKRARIFGSQVNYILSALFSGHATLKEVIIDGLRSTLEMNNFFLNCFSLERVTFTTALPTTSTASMFQSCNALKSVSLETTSSLASTLQMFAGCVALQEVPHFDTSGVTNMGSMFTNCFALQEVPHFDTSSATNVSLIFSGCRSLTTVPAFNLTSITDTNNLRMFSNCFALQEVPNFTFGTVTSGVIGSGFIANARSCTRVRNYRWPDANTTLTGCFNLGGEALNEIFGQLPTVTGSKTINVTPCRGRSLCDPGIAIVKGWTVTT